MGLANLINIFNPEIVIIGGYLSNIGDMPLRPAFKEAEPKAFKQAYQKVHFARAGLGQNSGVIGAAAFALHGIQGYRQIDWKAVCALTLPYAKH